MVEFVLLILFVWLIVFIYIRLKRRFFNRFIDASQKRVLIWGWIKRIVLVLVSIVLIIGGCERWYYFHDEIAYTDKNLLDMAYADQIDMEVYLMDQEKLISLFKGNPPESGTHDPGVYKNGYPEPEDPYFYLVIRVRNRGDQVAWGCLDNDLNGVRQLEDIDIPPLPPNMSDFTNIVLWWQRSPEYLPDKYPKLEVIWKKLYTSKEENL